MLLGFISLLLTVFQNLITKFCVPKVVVAHLLPCKPPEEKHVTHKFGLWQRALGRHLLSEESSSSSCSNGVANSLYTFFICLLSMIRAVQIWNLGRNSIDEKGLALGRVIRILNIIEEFFRISFFWAVVAFPFQNLAVLRHVGFGSFREIVYFPPKPHYSKQAKEFFNDPQGF